MTPGQGLCSPLCRQVDLEKVAAGDFGEQEEITAEEDPAFQRRLRDNRSVAPTSFALLASRSTGSSSARLKKLNSLSKAQQPFILAVGMGRSQHGN